MLYMQDNPAYLKKEGGYKYGYVVYDSCTVAQFEFLQVPSSSFEFLRGNFVINGEIVEVHPKKKV